MSDTKALAREVERRRLSLGLTQQDLADRTKRLDPKGKGFSMRTVTEIEAGFPRERQPATLRMLDLALEWPRGTSRSLLDGEGIPEGMTGSDAERVRALDARVAMMEDKLDTVLDALDALMRLRGLRDDRE